MEDEEQIMSYEEWLKWDRVQEKRYKEDYFMYSK